MSNRTLDEAARTLTLTIDFTGGSRFAAPGHDGEHAVLVNAVKRTKS